MTITCPHCGFSAEVSPDAIPADATEATCPQCNKAFALKPKAQAESQPIVNEMSCPACCRQQPAGSYCIECGIDFAKWQRRQEQAAQDASADQIFCPFCGHLQPPAGQCQQCGGVLPTGTISEATVYAGFWIRVVGAILDSIAVWVLQIVLTMILGAMVEMFMPATGGDSIASVVMLGLFSSAVGLAYYVVFTGACGQTPGKMVLRLKVVRSDGSSMTYGRAFLREVIGKFISGIILGIGYLMVAFDERKQGLHDKIADTCVIHL